MGILKLLIWLLGQPAQVGLGTIFDPGSDLDPLGGSGILACQGQVRRHQGPGAWQRARRVGIAHRTLPCGQAVLVCLVRTGRCIRAVVVDRGPFGALDGRGRWRLARRTLPAGWTWRGLVDLLPGPARKLGHNGLEPVLVVPLISTNATPDSP